MCALQFFSPVEVKLAWRYFWANAVLTVCAKAAFGCPLIGRVIVEKKPHKHGSFKNKMRQAASMASPQALANHQSVGTTDPRSYLSKSFPDQNLVQRSCQMNSWQGPTGMSNALIFMKNLGDYI